MCKPCLWLGLGSGDIVFDHFSPVCFLQLTKLYSLHSMDTVEVMHFDEDQLRPGLRAKLHSREEAGPPLTRTEWTEVIGVIVDYEKARNR